MPQSSRAPDTGIKREPKNGEKPTTKVKEETRHYIETVVNLLPLHELREYLQGRFVPEGWEAIEEEAGEEMPESEEEEAFDVDDFKDDYEGDFSEVEKEEESLLEVLENIGQKGYPQYADVMVKRLSDEIIVCSGSAHLLLHISGDDQISSTYKNALRHRVQNTVRIAQQIVSLNKDYFLQNSKELKLLARNKVLGFKKETVSRLVGSASLLAPWGELLPFKKFFVKRAPSTEVACSLLRVFARNQNTEQNEPFSDEEIANRLPDISRARSRVAQVRPKLGIPNQEERKKLYEEGKNFIDILIDRLSSLPCEKYDKELEKLKTLLKQAWQMESDADAKKRLQEWKEQIEKRCEERCQS